MTANRGNCVVCGRSIYLLKDGRVGRHGSREPFVWPPKPCLGWGEMPREQEQEASE